MAIDSSISTSSSPKSVTEIHTVVEPLESLNLNKTSRHSKSDVVVVKEKKNDTIDNINSSPVPSWSVCPVSEKSVRTRNPIRAIVDPIVKNIKSGKERGDGKDHISLALGDPTVGKNLPPCQVALDEVVSSALEMPHAAGYINACGLPEARVAIAKYHSYPEHKITSEEVIVASGCSGALELTLTALLDPGEFLLVPQPGFPLYQVICESHGASVIHYRLNPNQKWECDFDSLEEIMMNHKDRSRIRGILINNPSNPTGGVFSLHHLQEIVAFCNKYRLPIVADEVYGDITFGVNKFYPMAQVAAQCGRQVPVITTSGLAKQYLLPGWRVGWIACHDNEYGSLQEVQAGVKRLAQVLLGASHLVQSVIPKLLAPSVQMSIWKENLRKTLEKQAKFLFQEIAMCHGLQALAPQGAMYSMVRMDLTQLDLKDDLDFSTKLLEEENVFVLPGICFGYPNVFRVVFCCDEPILEAAAHRIATFCLRHAK